MKQHKTYTYPTKAKFTAREFLAANPSIKTITSAHSVITKLKNSNVIKVSGAIQKEQRGRPSLEYSIINNDQTKNNTD